MLREFFDCDCEVYFTFNGTAANSLALSSMCRSYHSIICASTSHVETDECGAPEFFSNGTKVLLVQGDDGKINLEEVEQTINKRTDIHYPKPKVLSLTQATELGTVYRIDEVQSACALAQKYKMKVHMDGARFANALASLGCAPKEITWQAGVDVLCFGGTKNGMAVGEAVVFFDQELANEFDYRCKQAGQLSSKMRYLSAPWMGMLQSGAVLRNAQNANHQAQRLLEKLQSNPNINPMFPVEANSVFLQLEPEQIKTLQDRHWHFYSFIGKGGCRFMCSWDTTDEDVDQLAADILAVF
jgi:threonine aldolase